MISDMVDFFDAATVPIAFFLAYAFIVWSGAALSWVGRQLVRLWGIIRPQPDTSRISQQSSDDP